VTKLLVTKPAIRQCTARTLAVLSQHCTQRQSQRI